MPIEASRKLSARQAARLIYRAKAPSDKQVGHVREAIERGDLSGSNGATSAGAVAEYLAQRAYSAQRGAPQATSTQQAAARLVASSGRASGHYGEQEDLPNVYLDSLRNYFLSALSRKHLKQQSKRLQRGVLVGQVVALVLSIGVIAYSARMISPPAPPEQEAVVAWLEANTDYYRIIRWHDSHPTADGSGVRLRVQYHYASKRGKGIDTDRLFLVQNGKVSSVESEW